MNIRILTTVPNPFAVDHYAKKQFVLQADVVFIYGENKLTVPRGYHFDGASIPRLLWSLSGMCPGDRETMLAACAHDWICDNPEELPRVVGDSIFLSILWGPVVLNGKPIKSQIGHLRAILMYTAVRLYGWWVLLTSGRV